MPPTDDEETTTLPLEGFNSVGHVCPITEYKHNHQARSS